MVFKITIIDSFMTFFTDTFNSDSSCEENDKTNLSVAKGLDRHSHSGGSAESLDSDTVSFLL